MMELELPELEPGSFFGEILCQRETGTRTNFNHQFWPIDALLISFSTIANTVTHMNVA